MICPDELTWAMYADGETVDVEGRLIGAGFLGPGTGRTHQQRQCAQDPQAVRSGSPLLPHSVPLLSVHSVQDLS